MHALALAFQFLTTIPRPRVEVRQPEDLGASMAWYPVVGAVLGNVLLGAYWAGSGLFPDNVVRPALIILLIGLTGGLHLDGLADVCDGFYAGRTPAEALRIMKDPHLGTMAVVGVVSLLVMKVVLLSSLPGLALGSALLLFPAIGRGGMVWGMWLAPYARPEGGTGATFFRTLRGRHVWTASIFLGLWTVFCVGWLAVIILLLAAAATGLFVGYCRRRIGGMTGDTLGALNELLEVLVLTVFYPLLRWTGAPGLLFGARWFSLW